MNDSRPPPEDLHSALERAVAPPPPEPEGVAEAVARFAAAVAGPEEIPAARDYRPREVAVILGVCAALLLAFDSESLMTWVQRMELGPIQNGWRAALSPINSAMDRVAFTGPRRWLVGSGEKISHLLGAGEDPLLAEGWDTDPQEVVARAQHAAFTALNARRERKPPLGDPAWLVPGDSRVAFSDPNEPPDPTDGTAEPIELPGPTAIRDQPGAEAVAFDDLPIAGATASPNPASGNRQAPVLLIGDSMIAGSLGASLSRALTRDGQLHVVQAFQTATGLARPDVYDWMKVLPPLLEREHPALIVCSLGANDPTGIRDGDRDLDFGEPGWRAAYSARVIEMMRTLSSTGARVLWLGLPPMRSARFSKHAQYLNEVFAQAAQKVSGVEFLELRMLISDSAGEYATFVRAPDGRLVRYRLDDGIHYSPAGARALTRWVVDWIYERHRTLPR